MKLMFWNLRRLGEGSDAARKAAIDRVVRVAAPDYSIFCEVVSTSTYPAAQQLSYRRSSAQLCYGCLDSALLDHPLSKLDVTATDAYKQAAFKGGNDFGQLVDRCVAYLGQVGPDNVHVYVLHAPATSASAQKAVSCVACFLDAYHLAAPWLLVGDLNVEPGTLEAAKVGIHLEDLIIQADAPTYIGRNADKSFDYALANFNAKVTRLRVSPRFHGSDHYPILVSW